MRGNRKIAEVMEEFADLLDQIEEHKSSLSLLNEQKRSLEFEIQDIATNTGLDNFKTDRVTVRIADKPTAKYEPDQWHAIVRWALDRDLLDVVQRRLTASKLQALAEDGVEFPDGLWLEQIQQVSHRRSSK